MSPQAAKILVFAAVAAQKHEPTNDIKKLGHDVEVELREAFHDADPELLHYVAMFVCLMLKGER